MLVKGIVEYDIVNYKKPAMFISTCFCDYKCCKEAGIPTSVCQNSQLASEPNVEISIDEIIDRYTNNPLSKAVVFGGMEPMKQFKDVLKFVSTFRSSGNTDDIVIYTGYREDELSREIESLKKFMNIVIKFGRYVPNSKERYDDVLGVTLASDNQYAKKL